MGLRNRSIPVQVGILVVVPLVFLVAIYAVVAFRSLSDAVAQTHEDTTRQGLALPVNAFQQQLAEERGDALMSLAQPSSAQLAGKFLTDEAATGRALARLRSAAQAPDVTSGPGSATAPAMRTLIARAAGLGTIRGAVARRAISLTTALTDYDSIISAGNNVLVAIDDEQSSNSVLEESLQSTFIYEADEEAGAEASLLAADLAQGQLPKADQQMLGSLAAVRQELIDNGLSDAQATLRNAYAQNMPAQISAAMTSAESAVASATWQSGTPPESLIGAESAFGTYALTLGKVVQAATANLPQVINQQRHQELVQVIAAAGVGLLALLGSVVLSLLVGRGLASQLRELRESALTLAHDRLPGIISKLRAGESIDIAGYAPGEAPKGNEISQVRHAFSVVQHAAVQSAVDESRLRRSVSEVFKNLAARSQSLLHRQLTLLDGMERRTTEPEQLEDLYRIDHLTTRMRRHAEGLIIMSGERPARGWRHPVPLADVLPGAVAEVEDYTRIRVLCRSRAAVAGHAVTDLIHLLAELAENATVFSPPNTPVRMQGDTVGRGFVVEIEDRGLGISRERLDEINARLADPPQFDLSGTERLGLFIVGQLARRHDIKVSLRTNVYDGITAVVLIPSALVVDETSAARTPDTAGQDDGIRAERNGRHAALTAIQAGSNSEADALLAATGPDNGHLAPDGDSGNGHLIPDGGSADGRAAAAGSADSRAAPDGGSGGSGGGSAAPGGGGAAASAAPEGGGAAASAYPAAESDSGSGRQSRWFARPAQRASRDEAPPQPPPSGTPAGESDLTSATADAAALDLPVRVPQANLAPQLRDNPGDAGAVDGGFSVPRRSSSGTGWPSSPPRPAPAEPGPAGAPASPEEARAMVSALQRGWRLGRMVSGHAAGQEDDETEPPGEG